MFDFCALSVLPIALVTVSDVLFVVTLHVVVQIIITSLLGHGARHGARHRHVTASLILVNSPDHELCGLCVTNHTFTITVSNGNWCLVSTLSYNHFLISRSFPTTATSPEANHFQL